jgi:hypothetical protein
MKRNKLLINTAVGAEQSSEPLVNQKNKINLTDEQLDALALSFLPAMTEFFESDQGKKLFEEYHKEKQLEKPEAA